MAKQYVEEGSRPGAEYRRSLRRFPYIKLKDLKRAIVICHRHADVDAYCSAYGAAHLLKKMKRRVQVTVAVPEGLSVLAARVQSEYGVPVYEEAGFEGVDLAVVVDTGHAALLSDLLPGLIKAECVKVFIDHHPLDPSVKRLGGYTVIDESASSASEVVCDLYSALGIPVSRAAAQVLLTGIIFDSQHLRLAGYRTVRTVAELCSRGASIGRSIELLSARREFSERVARLKGGQRVILYRFDDWILAATNIGSFQASVARALIELGADVAVAAGVSGGECKCSLRSTQTFFNQTGLHLGVDVASVTAELTGGVGGGHPTAASLTSEGDADVVLDAVLKVFGAKGYGLKVLK